MPRSLRGIEPSQICLFSRHSLLIASPKTPRSAERTNFFFACTRTLAPRALLTNTAIGLNPTFADFGGLRFFTRQLPGTRGKEA